MFPPSLAPRETRATADTSRLAPRETRATVDTSRLAPRETRATADTSSPAPRETRATVDTSPLCADGDEPHASLLIPAAEGARRRRAQSAVADCRHRQSRDGARRSVPSADSGGADRGYAAAERARFQREPADILITTPEAAYLLLTSNAREALRQVGTAIVDEIHALVPTKRGAHLALSLERLSALTASPSTHRSLGDAASARRSRPIPGAAPRRKGVRPGGQTPSQRRQKFRHGARVEIRHGAVARDSGSDPR